MFLDLIQGAQQLDQRIPPLSGRALAGASAAVDPIVDELEVLLGTGAD
jgi:hypothetical protein